MKKLLKSWVWAYFIGMFFVTATAQNQNQGKLLMTIGCLSDLHSDNQYLGKGKLKGSVVSTLAAMKEQEDVDVLLLGGDYTAGLNGTANLDTWKVNKRLLIEATEGAFRSGKTPYVIYANGNHDYQVGNGANSKYDSGDYYSNLDNNTFGMKGRLGELKEMSTPTAAPNECFYEQETKDSEKFNLLAAFHYQVNNFDFVVLNTGTTLYAGSGYYYYSIASVNWIAAKMKALFEENPDRTVFFVAHIPFGDSNNLANDHGQKNTDHNSADVLKAALAKYPNVIMLYGHDHEGDKAYIQKNTSERVTLYSPEGKVVSTTDSYHINGLVQANAKSRGMKMTVGTDEFALYNLGNGKFLNGDPKDTDSSRNNSVVSFTDTPQMWKFSDASYGNKNNLFKIALSGSSPEHFIYYGQYGKTSGLDYQSFKMYYKSYQESDNEKYNNYLYKIADSDISNIDNATSVTGTLVTAGTALVEDGYYFITCNNGGSTLYVMGNTIPTASGQQHTIDEEIAVTVSNSTITLNKSDLQSIGKSLKDYIYSLKTKAPTQNTFYGKLTVASGGHGSVSISGVTGSTWQGSASGSSSGSKTLELTATASDGYVLKGWSTNGAESGIINGSNVSPYSYTFTFNSQTQGSPTSETLTAIFVEKQTAATSFLSSFMGSMSYWHNKINTVSSMVEPDIYQALMIYVYEDRIVLQMKNFGEPKSGNSKTWNDVTIYKELTPYTIIRDVVKKDDQEADMIIDGTELVSVADGKIEIDDDVKSIEVKREVDDVEITYNRTVTTSNWQTWFVPFEFVITEDIAENFRFAKFGGAFAEENGTKYISFVAMNEGDRVLANTPFIFRSREAVSGITVRGNLIPSRTDIVCRIQSAEQYFDFRGIYEDEVQEAENGSDDQWLTINTKGEFVRPKKGVGINAMRVILEIEGIEGNGYISPKVESLGIKVMGVPDDWNEDFTWIAVPESVRKDSTLYDVTGRRLGGRNSLKKGMMYIVGKKKFVKD